MSEVVIYQEGLRQAQLSGRLDGETIWLTQRQMAELFDTSADSISRHVQSVFWDSELSEPATTKESSVVHTEAGARPVST